MPSSKPWLKYRKSTRYNVTFPTLPSLTVQPSEADLYQERMAHDVLVLRFPRGSQKYEALLKTGTPVLFSWQQSGYRNNWTGYVSHVSRTAAGQENKEMKVTCIGSSFLLKKRANRVWQKKSVTDVARIIAKEFNLKFVGDVSKRQFEQLSMTGETYWKFLKKQAERIGYIFTVQNSTMYMFPLEKFLNQSSSTAPILGIEKPALASQIKAHDKTLSYFNVLRGDYIESDSALYTTKNASGVNPVTSKVLSSISSPSNVKGTRTGVPEPLFQDYSKEVVLDSRTTKQASEDLALGSKFTFPAEARGQGDPRIAPYKAVFILGIGSAIDGFWAVTKVHHVFTYEGFYEIELALVTDGLGEGAPSPFRKAQGLERGRINVDSSVVAALQGVSWDSPSTLVSKGAAIGELNQGFDAGFTYWKGN